MVTMTVLRRLAGLAVAACFTAAAAPAFAADAPKKEEEPFWAKGRPNTEAAMKMAPVPAFPIPTPADRLPVNKMKLPPGFKAECTFRSARPATSASSMISTA